MKGSRERIAASLFERMVFCLFTCLEGDSGYLFQILDVEEGADEEDDRSEKGEYGEELKSGEEVVFIRYRTDEDGAQGISEEHHEELSEAIGDRPEAGMNDVLGDRGPAGGEHRGEEPEEEKEDILELPLAKGKGDENEKPCQERGDRGNAHPGVEPFLADEVDNESANWRPNDREEEDHRRFYSGLIHGKAFHPMVIGGKPHHDPRCYEGVADIAEVGEKDRRSMDEFFDDIRNGHLLRDERAGVVNVLYHFDRFVILHPEK